MILECTGMNQNDTRMDHSVPCSAQLCFIQCQSGALGHSSTFHSFVYLVTFWNGGGVTPLQYQYGYVLPNGVMILGLLI